MMLTIIAKKCFYFHFCTYYEVIKHYNLTAITLHGEILVKFLQGWQRKLDPDYDIMHTLRTLLVKADWAKSLAYTIEGIMAP